MEFRLLGPFELVVEGRLVTPKAAKQRALLALLLLNANRPLSAARLVDDLWGERPPATVAKVLQTYVSRLRRLLGAESIASSAAGYELHVGPGELDVHRFERLVTEAADLEPEPAGTRLRQALALWRGPPLVDFAYETWAQPEIARLDKLRLAALRQRIDCDLALGRAHELVGELEQLVAEHPLRERLRGQLMLALYRSDRQVEALDVYRKARQTLVEQLGLEPAAMLRELEHAILTHDPSLEVERVASARPARAILVVPSAEDRLDALLAIAEPFASHEPRELIIARLLPGADELAREASTLNVRKAMISAPARVAVFTTDDAVADLLRLATLHDVELILVDSSTDPLRDDLTTTLERAAADVALVAGPALDPSRSGGVFVPFGGGEHDWAALELGAWLAAGLRTPLTLVGTDADARVQKRDASRLLADASLAVQRVVGVETSPLLADANEEALVAAVEPASVVVTGISPRWRRDGIGATRRALVRDARAPTVLVHRGPRPGGLAPQETRTRYSWTIDVG